MANQAIVTCRNCGHVHPSTTSKSTTHYAAECDHPGCKCVTFKMSARYVTANGQLHSDDTPAGALAKENAALKEHIEQLRTRLPEVDPTFGSTELKATQQEAAAIHAEHTRLTMKHATVRRQVELSAIALAAELSKARKLADAVSAIVTNGYSPTTHGAVANGISQVNEQINVLTQLVQSLTV